MKDEQKKTELKEKNQKNAGTEKSEQKNAKAEKSEQKNAKVEKSEQENAGVKEPDRRNNGKTVNPWMIVAFAALFVIGILLGIIISRSGNDASPQTVTAENSADSNSDKNGKYRKDKSADKSDSIALADNSDNSGDVTGQDFSDGASDTSSVDSDDTNEIRSSEADQENSDDINDEADQENSDDVNDEADSQDISDDTDEADTSADIDDNDDNDSSDLSEDESADVIEKSDKAGSKDTGNKDNGSKDKGSKNTGSKNSGSKDTGSKDSGSKDTGSKDTGSKDTGSKDTGSKDTGSKDTGSKDTGSKDTGSKDTGSKDTGSKDTGSKDTGSKDTGSKDTGSKDTGSKDNGKEEYVLSYSSDNSWSNGKSNMYGMQIGITNNTKSTVSGWKLVLTIDGLSEVDGWNGTYTIDGSQLKVSDAGYNSDVYAGGTIAIGCNLGTTASSLKVTKATINGKEMRIEVGAVKDNNVNNGGNGGNNNNDNNNNNNNNDNNDKNSGLNSDDVRKLLERSKDAVQGDDWLHTDGKNILDKDGKKVWLTGLNWFGYNTGTNTFDGLWNSQLEPTVKAIADHGFNLIRVPMSAELINQWSKGEYPKANYNNAYNTALNSMNSLEIWDYFLSLAEANGIKVMPDIHSAETNASGHNVNLWCTGKVKVEDFYHALEWMAERYKNNDTIIAYDLKNEPHGKPYEGDAAAIWNDSKSANNWKYVAETAASRILKKNPNVLILVEGTEIYPIDIKKNSDYHSTNDKDYYFNWWGGNLRAVADFPINLGKYQNKLVYSPHDYGPTVYEQPWFEGKYDYDSLMKDCWHDNWFFIYEKNIAPLLIGEWGGFMTKPNITWMTYMRQLIKKYNLNHTFWCLNANSGDTGGLLKDDFVTWDSEKYKFVKEVLWQEGSKFVGLDHAIPLGENGITLKKAKGLK